MLKRLIMSMLGIVIGVSMLPTVITSVDALDTLALPTAVQGLVDLLPILYVVVIVVIAIGYVSFNSRE